MTARTALYLVNEYGEFSELLRLAKHLKRTIDLDGVFLFARDDYGRLQQHGQAAKEAGFRALSTDYDQLAEWRWREKDAARTDEGYRPSSVAEGNRVPVNGRLAALALLAITILIGLALVLPLIVLTTVLIVLFALRYVIARLSQNVKLREYIASKSIFQFPRILLARSRIKRWSRHAGKVLRVIKPDVILMGQDYPGSYNALLLKHSSRKKIPAAIVPFAMYTSRETAESFYGMPEYVLRGRFQRWLFLTFFRKWTLPYRGRLLIRLPISEIIALELTGNSLKHPWSPQASRAKLLAQSPKDRAYYASVGRDEASLELTGTLWNDDLAEAQQRADADRALIRRTLNLTAHIRRIRAFAANEGFEVPASILDAIWDETPGAALKMVEASLDAHSTLLEKLDATVSTREADTSLETYDRRLKLALLRERHAKNMETERRVVIVAWPANQFSQRSVPPHQTYQEFNGWLVERFVRFAHTHDVDIWISLHPTLYGVVDIAEMEAAGLHVIRWPLISYLHTADLFVATVSTTLLWAVQCAIPAVNFDCYDYGYREFAEMGCLTCVSTKQFDHAMRWILSDATVAEILAAQMHESREQWMMHDGKSGERISDTIAGLIGASRIDVGASADGGDI
ncbi:MAG: hypothetical protein AAFZ01_05075 [Pseudomonadota bacterium]